MADAEFPLEEMMDFESTLASLAPKPSSIDRDRLIVAPDCGLGLLGRELAREKMTNLCQAAQGF